MKLYLITLLSILLFSCKKQAGKPEPDHQGTIKSLSTTRTKNSNGHQVLTTYQYNSAGAPYLETSKDESTGLEIFQDYRYKQGSLYASDIYSDQRKLSQIEYTYQEKKLNKMRYLEYDQYLNTTLNFEQYFEYVNGQVY